MLHTQSIAGGVSLALSAGAFAQALPLSLNLDTAYADTKAAMLAGDADIVCIGDSLTFRPGAYLPYFSNRLRTTYGDGGNGFLGISFWTGASFDPGWIYGVINTDVPPYRSLDNLWAGISPTFWNQTLSIITSYAGTGRLYYQAQPGGGTFSIERPGQPLLYVGTNAPQPGLGIIDIPTTLSSRFGYIVRTYAGQSLPMEEQPGEGLRPIEQGPFILYGINWRSNRPGVRVHRAANGGWGVDNFLQRDQSFTDILRDINPQMYIIKLGQNDGRIDPAQYVVRMNALVDRLLATTPDAEIVLVSTYDSGAPAVFALGNSMYTVAQQRGLGFINLRDAGGEYQSYLDRGYLDPDLLHFSPDGGRFVANLLFDALESGGASLTAACSDIEFNNNGVYPEEQDIFDFLTVLAGGPCPTAIASQPGCDSIDFNRDNVFPDDQDIIDFFNVLSGGTCQ